MLGDQARHRYPGDHQRGTERVVRAAFRLARRRDRPRPRVTCVDKANILRSFAFFRKVFDEVAAEFPGVEADHLYVDAAAMEMVRRPGRFDVLVTENLLGDILSDLAAGLVGGLGVAPSADLGDRHAVFQPCHGTAPTSRAVASPIPWPRSSRVSCSWIIWPTRTTTPPPRRARRIDAAVAGALASGQAHTADIGGHASTADLTRDPTRSGLTQTGPDRPP
ncbi:MAG: isocitrate/isopropylmalate family dehydrogenase [Singulisphaera sp.]